MANYFKKSSEKLNDNLFENPTSEYRGIPFWSWNCKVTEELIDRQIECFQKMGFGGADIHPRVGLDTEYLGEEFMQMIRHTVELCKEKDLLCWLYDEDRYPSGVAAGMVTKDLRFAARGLLLTKDVCESEGEFLLPGYAPNREVYEREISSGKWQNGYFATAYVLEIEEEYLLNYYRLQNQDDILKAIQEQKLIRFAYVKISRNENAFHGSPYVDTMNPEAIKRFIDITHEKYFSVVGEEFGKTAPAMFTDEPRVYPVGNEELETAESVQDVTLPYTEYMAEQMKVRYGIDFLDIVPECIWECNGGKHNRNRYVFQRMKMECFSEAYMDQIALWCKAHGIAMTGHILSEENLRGQTRTVGDCMRVYREMDLPGVDILCDSREYSTIKQVSSVVRQMGKDGAVSELYGVTQWDCDFKTYKLQGDWQAALGITVRIPHLSWMSMEGEAKRDWPASISYQSPWYEEWPYIEQYFARLNTVLTRGNADCRIAMIHPVESMWLYQGALKQTVEKQEDLDRRFAELNQWLLYGLQDFDYISEALLPELWQIVEADECVGLKVGEMTYTTVIVPFLYTIRNSTLQALKEFEKRGGRIIFLGEVAELVDAFASDEVRSLAMKCCQIPYEEKALLDAIETERIVDVLTNDGSRAANLLYQMRNDENCKWLFICHGNASKNGSLEAEQYLVRIKGCHKVNCYDAMTGVRKLHDVYMQDGWTVLCWNAYAEDSILLKLEMPDSEMRTDKDSLQKSESSKEHQVLQTLTDIQEIVLEEPNVVLLDFAKYQLDSGPVHDRTEILKIDNHVRNELGFMLRGYDVFQPWAMPEKENHKLTLYYEVESEIECDCKLAMEKPEYCKIFFNGKEIRQEYEGYYVDESIVVMPLGRLVEGENLLTIEMNYNQKSNPENIYILGDFGVKLHHDKAVVTEYKNEIELGDIGTQGMPFYTGNAEYRFCINVDEKKEYCVCVPHYKAPLLGVSVDGVRQGLIAYSPHQLSLGVLQPGEHMLGIKMYGNRHNCFGPIHNANENYTWWGPDSFRTKGEIWTDGYCLRPVGIFSGIEIICKD